MTLFSTSERTRGQSLVELALVLPLAVLILALAADFGRAFTSYIQISGAAREGAAYGMQSSGIPTGEIEAAALAEIGSPPTIWGVQPVVDVSSNCSDGMNRPDNTPYECVAVTVQYSFQPLITIGPIPNTIPMERTVEMRVVN